MRRENGSVLVVDDMYHTIQPLLAVLGLSVDYKPEISREQILQTLDQYTGLIIRSKTSVDQELIDCGTSLKFVARAGAGIDKLDIDYLKSKDIAIFNAPEGNRDALGEHTLGMLLAILHKIASACNQVRLGIWEREANRGVELGSLTVGVYGVGHMGHSFAVKLSGLGCRVIGYDKYKTNYSNEFIQETDIDEFIAETEVLSIHLPLSDESRQLFSYDYLQSFPKLKIVLNTSRGGVVSTEGILKLLEENELEGAGLDVLENEKINSYSDQERSVLDRLLGHPNVLITPHVAGWTKESYHRINEVLVKKISTLF
ncbi:MAG: NAD(P)-dependent oxidoreductase [Bacteroidota bacterium]